jgi:hypothetical protein
VLSETNDGPQNQIAEENREIRAEGQDPPQQNVTSSPRIVEEHARRSHVFSTNEVLIHVRDLLNQTKINLGLL